MAEIIDRMVCYRRLLQYEARPAKRNASSGGYLTPLAPPDVGCFDVTMISDPIVVRTSLQDPSMRAPIQETDCTHDKQTCTELCVVLP